MKYQSQKIALAYFAFAMGLFAVQVSMGLLAGWIGNRDVKTAGCYGAVSASFLVERVGLPAMGAALQRAAQERLQVALAAASKM